MKMPKFEARAPSLLKNACLARQKEKFSPLFPQKLSKSFLSLYFSITSSARRYRRAPLFFGDHVISEDADVADLDFNSVAWDHIAVSSLGAHPEHIARVEGRVPAQLLNPGRCIPNLVG